ncbi:hypothetical protein NIES4071_54740 [Calothrix sp. NIES-4071]|nr:hypothetical protein NIES4071_54740 [Calothrix sp. NIES-4071]BAZ59782.1 hypothetical protein NIES4105_54690 [Calothrix sp. NIES-4105]
MSTLPYKQQKLIEAIQTLSEEAIEELTDFVAYLQYKTTNSQTSQDSIHPLNPNKVYEVWTPIEAPEAAKTLMSLLATEEKTGND